MAQYGHQVCISLYREPGKDATQAQGQDKCKRFASENGWIIHTVGFGDKPMLLR